MTSIHNSADVRAVLEPLERKDFPQDAFDTAAWEAYVDTYKKCTAFFEAVAQALPALGMELLSIGFYPAQNTDGYKTIAMQFDLCFVSEEAFSAAMEKYGVDDEALFDTANHESLRILNEAARSSGLLGHEKYELLDGAYKPYKWNTPLRNEITVTVG